MRTDVFLYLLFVCCKCTPTSSLMWACRKKADGLCTHSYAPRPTQPRSLPPSHSPLLSHHPSCPSLPKDLHSLSIVFPSLAVVSHCASYTESHAGLVCFQPSSNYWAKLLCDPPPPLSLTQASSMGRGLRDSRLTLGYRTRRLPSTSASSSTHSRGCRGLCVGKIGVRCIFSRGRLFFVCGMVRHLGGTL